MSKLKIFFRWIQCDDKAQVSMQQNPRHSSYSKLFTAALACFCLTASVQAQLGNAVRQVIVARAANWNSDTAHLQAYQRASSGDPWQPVFSQPFPVLLGRSGLAWG